MTTKGTKDTKGFAIFLVTNQDGTAMQTRSRTCWILIAAGVIVGCSRNDQPDKKAPSPVAGPGFTAAKLDPDNVENTRAWAEKAVARLKELEAKGDRKATDAEVARLEKEMRDALQDKKIRWALVIDGARKDGEVDLAQFFGNDDGKIPDGKEAGKKRRKLYMRVYLAADGDEVRIGDEIDAQQAMKGNTFTLERQVIETNIRQRDTNWRSRNLWTDVVDVLDTFCVDIIVKRK
jgi:hypothetical protein